jgi:hypothetical protein
MGLAVAAVVLWVATIIRLVVTIKRPDPTRILMVLAAVCVSMAFSVGAVAPTFDSALDWPNGAELVSHLLFAAGAYFTLLFLHAVRHGWLTRSVVIGHSILAGLVVTAMVTLFSVANVHDQSAGSAFASVYIGDGAATLYRLVFSAYFVYCLVSAARTCWRHAFAQGDQARSLSLIGIGIGAAIASVASLASTLQLAVSYLTGTPADVLGAINVIGVAAAGIVAGLGVLVPIPLDALLRWRNARRVSDQLELLWRDLTTVMPEVVLSVPSGPNPIEHAEMISTRRRIEIADALNRIHIDLHAARTIERSPNPPEALGRALREATTWRADPQHGVLAADLLSAAADDDLGQLLTLAGAYGAGR